MGDRQPLAKLNSNVYYYSQKQPPLHIHQLKQLLHVQSIVTDQNSTLDRLSTIITEVGSKPDEVQKIISALNQPDRDRMENFVFLLSHVPQASGLASLVQLWAEQLATGNVISATETTVCSTEIRPRESPKVADYVVTQCKALRAKTAIAKEKKRQQNRYNQRVFQQKQKAKRALIDAQAACSSAPVKFARAEAVSEKLKLSGSSTDAKDIGEKLLKLQKGQSKENPTTDVVISNAYTIACQDLGVKPGGGSCYSWPALGYAASRLGVSPQMVRLALLRTKARQQQTGSPFGKIHGKRGPKGWLHELEPHVLPLIRNVIHQELFQSGTPFTLRELHKRIKDDPEIGWNRGVNVLRQALKSMGFRYRKGLGQQHVLYGSQRVVQLRCDYLKIKRKLEMKYPDRQVVYLDESWLESSDDQGRSWHDLTITPAQFMEPGSSKRQAMSMPTSSFKRLMLISAIGKNGIIPGSSVCWPVDEKLPSLDPHANMTSRKFELYLRRLLDLPGIEEDCLIILDNARYHRALNLEMPETTTKAGLLTFIRAHATQPEDKRWLADYDAAAKKPGYADVMKATRAVRRSGGLKTETLVAGHEKHCKLFFLPPYHPMLNPIEHYWSLLKNRIRKTRGSTKRNTNEMKMFVEQAMSNTENDAGEKAILVKTFAHVAKVENSFIETDHIDLAPVVRPLIIHLTDGLEDSEADDDTDEDDSDIDDE